VPTETAILVLAADPAPASPEGSGGFGGMGPFVPMILIFVIFYVLLIRPQSKERKKREEQLRSVRKHDKVVTNGGMHGTVVALNESDVVLRVDDASNVRIRVERSALWQIRSRADEAEEGERPAEAAVVERAKEKGKATG
jgi:preprotein translocase subunit YajC